MGEINALTTIFCLASTLLCSPHSDAWMEQAITVVVVVLILSFFFFLIKSKNKKAAALPFVLAAPLDSEKGMNREQHLQ